MTGFQDDILKASSLPLPWGKLEGCNILILGATGLIGSCLVKVLLARNEADYHIYAGGRDRSRAKILFKSFETDERFHFLPIDVTSPINCDIDFHFMIDAASNASPNFFASNPVEIMKSNIYGVANLLDYGKEHNLKRFLFVSSGEIYGQGDGRPFTEDYSGFVDYSSPRSCYPSSKRAAEVLCQAYAQEYGLDVTIARPCHVYGPYFSNHDNRVYAQFFRNLLNNEDIILRSDGSQYRSWCYVIDCVSALFYILLKGDSKGTYNVADPFSVVSIRELADKIASLKQKAVIVQIPDISEQKGYNPVTRSVFDTTKIESLGWSPQDSMDNNLRKTYSELLNTRF